MPRFSFLQPVLRAVVTVLGSDLTDERTGRKMARALVVAWRGRIYLLGLEGDDQVRPVFLPQEGMPFWRRAIGFSTYPAPDFPREPAARAAEGGGEVCFLLLAHQPP